MNKSKQTEPNNRKTLDLPAKIDQKDLTNTHFNRTANCKCLINRNSSISHTSSLSSKHTSSKPIDKLSNKNVVNFHDQTISCNRIHANQPINHPVSNHLTSDYKILDFKNLNQILSDTPTSSKQDDINQYPCNLCGLNLYDPSRYNFHLSKIHKIDRRINYIQCYVTDCEEKFKKRMELVDHLNDVHKLEIKIFKKVIKDLDEFNEWKNEIERQTGFKWVENNKSYLNNRLRNTFICNRTATNGIKLYSLHGLTTINNHSTLCLSSIKITENDNKTFLIEFIETHNHDE